MKKIYLLLPLLLTACLSVNFDHEHCPICYNPWPYAELDDACAVDFETTIPCNVAEGKFCVKQTLRGPTTIVVTPTLSRTIEHFYGCFSIEGTYLE